MSKVNLCKNNSVNFLEKLDQKTEASKNKLIIAKFKEN